MKTLYIPLAIVIAASLACDVPGQATAQPQAPSGISKAQVKIATGSDGLSAEQRNVRDRLVEDNKPGAIKHLYIISAYSGQTIFYSTVRGKVTSSGKRLNPATLTGTCGEGCQDSYNNVPGVGFTTEVLGDDGVYGSSVEYIYWWDSKGIYHQQYVTGGMIVHVSSEPIAVKSIIINVEQQ